MNCRLRSLSLSLCLFLLALLSGCGSKGPVRPLAQPLPAAPPDISLHQQGDGLLLSWALPHHNRDGSELTDLAGFRVYRRSFEPGEDCPDCRNDAPLWRLVELDYLRHAQLRNDQVFLLDHGLQAGQGYYYKVVPFNRWGQDGPAIEQRQVLATPPPAPAGLAAESSNSRLLLNWQPPVLNQDMELLGYHIYRRRPGYAFAAAPRNDKLLSEPSFEDHGFEPGRTYIYAVRTLVLQNGEVQESVLSDILVITPDSGF